MVGLEQKSDGHDIAASTIFPDMASIKQNPNKHCNGVRPPLQSFATWNLCLGLANKKDTVNRYLNENNIKVCCLQETEIPQGFPENILNSGGYILELEMNSEKKRVGVYLHRDVNYVRRFDLEKENHHIVIIDVKTNPSMYVLF